MKKETIIKAVTAARIFIEREKKLTPFDYEDSRLGVGNKRTGALRRASMELTRALADLRKSGD